MLSLPLLCFVTSTSISSLRVRSPPPRDRLCKAALMCDHTTQPSHAFALAHRRVMFTAPHVYATRLSAALFARRARPVHMPTISTEPLPDTSALRDAVLTLSDYDIIAFPSRSAVLHFAAAFLSSHIPPDILLRASGVRLAALGADALAVRDTLGATIDIMSATATPSALAELIGADDDNKGVRVLVPVPVVKGMKEPHVIPEFLDALSKAGCQVSAVPAYVTQAVDVQKVDVELDMLLSGTAVHALVISSIAEAQALYAMLLRLQQVDKFVKAVRNGTLVLAAHGPVTAGGVRSVFQLEDDGDMDKVLVSKKWSSFDGVVQAVEEEFTRRDALQAKLIV